VLVVFAVVGVVVAGDPVVDGFAVVVVTVVVGRSVVGGRVVGGSVVRIRMVEVVGSGRRIVVVVFRGRRSVVEVVVRIVVSVPRRAWSA